MRIEAGQVAVVTGAASGIGLALTSQLVERGVTVVMADIEDRTLAEAAVRTGADVPPQTVVCDVSEPDSVAELRRKTIAAHGHVDLLFNNAGVFLPLQPMWERSLDDWSWIFGVNLWGVVHGIREFAPLMVARGTGHIVNTASMAGVSVLAGNGLYNATKHAVVSLSETLAAEFALHAPGMRASVICPGLVPTRISDAARNRPGAPRPTYGNTGSAGDLLQNAGEVAEASRPSEVTAGVVAQRVLAAVEANLVYIFTNPDSEQRAEARFADIRRDLDACRMIIDRRTS